jgi:hypothetical protein
MATKLLVIFYLFTSQSVGGNENDMDPRLLVHTSDIQRKVISTRIVSKPPLSAQRTHQMNEWVAHAKIDVLIGFKRENKGGI